MGRKGGMVVKRLDWSSSSSSSSMYTVDLEMSEIHTVVPPVYECKFIPNSYHYW